MKRISSFLYFCLNAFLCSWKYSEVSLEIWDKYKVIFLLSIILVSFSVLTVFCTFFTCSGWLKCEAPYQTPFFPKTVSQLWSGCGQELEAEPTTLSVEVVQDRKSVV